MKKIHYDFHWTCSSAGSVYKSRYRCILLFVCLSPLAKPSITVGIQASLPGFWVSKVEFINKFKWWKASFGCQCGNIKPIPYHLWEAGFIIQKIQVRLLSCIIPYSVYSQMYFFLLPGLWPDKTCQAKQGKLFKATA